jgi:hypothetical protein
MTIYEAVDGPAVVIDGWTFTQASEPLRIVQQSRSYGRMLFRPMTELLNCEFDAGARIEPFITIAAI